MSLARRTFVAAPCVAAGYGVMIALVGCPGELAPLRGERGERDAGPTLDAASSALDALVDSADAGDAGPPPPQIVAFDQNQPVRLAVDGTNVYWTDYGTGGSDGFLVKASVRGDSQERLVSYIDPWGIALNGGYVYWTSYGSSVENGDVSRIPIDGGAVETLASGQSYPWSVATDGITVYWTQQIAQAGTVSAGSVTMPSPTAFHALYQDLSYASGLALRAGTLYFTNYEDNGGLYALPATGGPVIELADNQDHPFAVAADANNVYWSTHTAVMAVPLGGGVPTTLANAAGRIIDIAVDSKYVYWTDYTANSITEVPLSGGEPITLATGQNGAYGIALDDAYVYWTTYVDGTVMRMPKWPIAADGG